MNNFKKCFKYTFSNIKAEINIHICINYYLVYDNYYDDFDMIRNSHELLEYLKEYLDIESNNKLVNYEDRHLLIFIY